MHINIYEHLPKEAKLIRETVFMKEQGFFNEFDEIDSYAKHLVLFDEQIPIATCRFFKYETNEDYFIALNGTAATGFTLCETNKDYFIGRIAVIKEYRGKNIGATLLKAAETNIRNIGGKRIFLHAQCRAKNFYLKQGYSSYGKIVLEENCPHIWMCKIIEK